MPRGAATRRYARALFQLAREDGRVAEVREELSQLVELLEGSAELRAVLLQPVYPVAERRAVLEAVADRLGASPLLHHFYAFLIDQRRLVEFEGIQAEFERLADEEAGVVHGQLRSASPLSEEQLADIRRALAARTGRDVQLAVEVDPSLIGGVVAQVGDLLFDGSLRKQLEQLRAGLTRS